MFCCLQLEIPNEEKLKKVLASCEGVKTIVVSEDKDKEE